MKNINRHQDDCRCWYCQNSVMTTAQQRRMEARERRWEAFRPVATHVVAFATGALLIAVTVRNHTGVSASVVGSSQSGKNLRSYRG